MLNIIATIIFTIKHLVFFEREWNRCSIAHEKAKIRPILRPNQHIILYATPS